MPGHISASINIFNLFPTSPDSYIGINVVPRLDLWPDNPSN